MTPHLDVQLHYVMLLPQKVLSLRQQFNSFDCFQKAGPLDITNQSKSHSLSHAELHIIDCCAVRKSPKQYANFLHFIFGNFFPFPIWVPTHYRILSVPLPSLILIFPLVGFISFASPLTLTLPH